MKKTGLSAFALHILAMVTMLIDHCGYLLFPRIYWMRALGRLAFPIFAFFIVEGFYHTRSREKYFLRLFLGALLSEIPFNLFVSGTVWDLHHQNVLWTFCLAYLLMWGLEQLRGRSWRLFAAVGAVFLGLILGEAMESDYCGAGVLTVLIFYFFRGENWKCRICMHCPWPSSMAGFWALPSS